MIFDKEHSDIILYPFVTSIENKVAHVSEEFAMLTGFSEEELQGRTLQELTLLLHMNVQIADIVFESDIYIFTKHLEPRNVQVIKGESSTDSSVYYFGERPHSRLDEKFPVIHQVQKEDIMGVAIFKMPEILLLSANRTWLEFLDKPYTDPLNSFGRTISEIITGWKGSTSERLWHEFTTSGKAFRNKEYKYENFSRGETYWDASLTPVKENGVIKFAIEITTDITDKVMQKKRLEEQAATIQNQNEHIKATLNNITEAIFIIDKDNNIIQYNKAAQEFFYDSMVDRKLGESMKHTKYCDVNARELAFEELPAVRILQGETIKHYRLIVKRPDRTQHYNLSGSPIRDEHGNIVEALICCSDITEHIHYEEAKRAHHEAMIEAEKREKKNLQEVLRLKDEFLYFMSHEFKTPLTVINAAIQALEHIYRDQMPDKAFEMIKKIKQNAFRQLRIVNNILDITKINAGKIKTNKTNMDILLLLRAIVESVTLFAQQKGVELIFETSVEQKIIGVDEEKLERILLNLLSNAIKFTPKGKKIFVRLSIKRYKGKEVACIEVEDQGIGIPEDKKQIVFERFGQVENNLSRQAEGTGIGLNLVKLLVEHLGGAIELESELGVGSIFRVMLPTKRVNNIKERRTCYEVGSKLVEKTAIEFSDIYL